jgi:hypothetical protein
LVDLQLVDLLFQGALSLQKFIFCVRAIFAHLVDAATLGFELVNLHGTVGNLGGGSSV